MESLNDLVWTDEEFIENDLVQRAAMVGPCSISISSCENDGNSPETSCVNGSFGAGIHCGC